MDGWLAVSCEARARSRARSASKLFKHDRPKGVESIGQSAAGGRRRGKGDEGGEGTDPSPGVRSELSGDQALPCRSGGPLRPLPQMHQLSSSCSFTLLFLLFFTLPLFYCIDRLLTRPCISRAMTLLGWGGGRGKGSNNGLVNERADCPGQRSTHVLFPPVVGSDA